MRLMVNFWRISPEEDFRCSGEGREHGWNRNSSDVANGNNMLTRKSYIKHTGHAEWGEASGSAALLSRCHEGWPGVKSAWKACGASPALGVPTLDWSFDHIYLMFFIKKLPGVNCIYIFYSRNIYTLSQTFAFAHRSLHIFHFRRDKPGTPRLPVWSARLAL